MAAKIAKRQTLPGVSPEDGSVKDDAIKQGLETFARVAHALGALVAAREPSKMTMSEAQFLVVAIREVSRAPD